MTAEYVRETLPTPHPLEVEWEFNGDFYEIGYHEQIPDEEDEDGYRLGEWIVLGRVYPGCLLDPEADETWKVVRQVGCLMAAAPRMLAALKRVKDIMDEDVRPAAYSLDDYAMVTNAVKWADAQAEFWTRE